MKKFTRILSLALATLMLLGTLAGCGGKKSGYGKHDRSDIPEVNFPLEEPYHIKLAVKGNVDYEKRLALNTFYQQLIKETNVYIDWINLGDEPLTTLNAMLATGEPIDAIVGVLTDTTLSDLAYGEFLLPIEDYVTDEKLMPNYVNRGLADCPQALATMMLPDGHAYSIARIDGNPGAYLESPLVVNTKWVKAAGLDEIVTIDDLHTYLCYVRDNDANGNGNPNDEVPLLITTSTASPYSTVQAVLSMWGLATKDSALDSYCVVKNGKVSLAPLTEAYKDAMRTIGEWYKEGLIWTEVYTANAESFKGRLNNVDYQQWGAVFDGFEISQSTKYYGDLAMVALPKVEGYEPCAYMNSGFNGYKNTFTVTSNSEHPEIVLAWLDKFYSAEGTLNGLYGLIDDPETVGTYPTYEKNEDGSYNFIALTSQQTDFNKEIRETFSNMWGSYTYLRTLEDYATGKVSLNGIAKQRMDAYETTYKDIANKEIWPRPYYTEETTDRIGLLRTDIFSIISQYEAQWVTGQSSVDADWDTYVGKLEKIGVDELVDLLQGSYDTYLKNYEEYTK